MVKEIIKDEFFLKQKSKSCTKEDLYIGYTAQIIQHELDHFEGKII